MERIIKPDRRAWISPLVNLQEMAEKFPELEAEFGFKPLTQPERSINIISRTAEEKAAVLDLVTFVLAKPNKPATSSSSITTAEGTSKLYSFFDDKYVQEISALSLDAAARYKQEIDAIDIDYDKEKDVPWYRDDESHDDIDPDNPDLWPTDDEDEEDESEEEDEDLAQKEAEKYKEVHKEQLAGTTRKMQDEVDAQDEKDFEAYYRYNEKKSKERAQIQMKRELDIFSENYPFFDSVEKYSKFAKKTCPLLGSDKHEVMTDDPIFVNVEMPLLAGAIPHSTLRNLTTLSLYTVLADEPGNFQWKSTHVMDQLSSTKQQQKQEIRECQRDMRHKIQNPGFAPGTFIVTVSFFHPSEIGTFELKSPPEPKPALTIEVLSDHTLEDMRQKFYCQKDYACTKDVDFKSWNTIEKAVKMYGKHLAKNVIRGDILYLGDTCYTDGSEEGLAYYEKVSKWTQTIKSKEIQPFKYGLMNETKIRDLNIRFGYPYCYQHQGDCEHLVVFNTARAPNAAEYKKASFPRHEVVGKFASKLCRIDKEFLARWIVVGSDRFPEDPVALCESCVHEYCFDAKSGNNRKKRGEFKLYPFIQVSAFI